MNAKLSLEHINQPVEITYYETEGQGPFQRVGILQGFYVTGKGTQFWMAGRTPKQFAANYSLRALAIEEADHRRTSDGEGRALIQCERLLPEHIGRVVEIEYTTAHGKPTSRAAGRLLGYDETDAGLEWWMHGRTSSRRAITYTIHHYQTTAQTSGANQ